MPYRIVRLVSFRGELRERIIDIPGNVLRIGRGTSNDLHLEDLGVSLTHAVITRDPEDRYVIRDLTQAAATYVNGAPTTEATLRDGDRVRIQHYVLSMSQSDSSSPLVLTVEEPPRPQSEPFLEMMPRLQLSRGRWTKKALATALTLLIVGGATLAVGMRKPELFMPGSVSLKHAKFSNQCEKCHVTVKAVWNVVPNKTCQTCHSEELLTPSHFGDRALTPAPQCASCHLEHKGQSILATVPDSQCVGCHGDLKARDPVVPVGMAIHSFTKDHPQFAISRALPDKAVPTRVRLDEKTVLRDDGKLKLNHAVHLEPLKTEAGEEEKLNCMSCHRTDGEGRYMQPIKYQRDCMRCHAIEFDPLLPGRSVTHGRQPSAVRQELEEIYAGLYLRTFPEETKKSLGTRRLPGQPPTPQEKYVDERIARAERILYPPGGKKCLKCHFAESGSNSVLKVNVPERWLPYSRFDHTAHFALPEIKAKGNVCITCHENAPASKKTEDVLLPTIGLCRTCHVEPGGAQAGCKACHDFHPKLIAGKVRPLGDLNRPSKGNDEAM